MTDKTNPTDLHRSDKDRVELIENGRFEIQQLPNVGFYAIDLTSNFDVFKGDVFFDSWRSCCDAIIDLNEGN